jgi:phosphate transport system substrate-binding protein
MTFLRTMLALSWGAALLLPSAGRAEEVLRVSGTGTAIGTMKHLAAAFARANPGHRLKALPSVGSGGAFRAVAQGALDIGLSARPLKADEVTLGLVSLPYARTPFVFATEPRAGVTGLTTTDVIRIYRGELTRWPNGERLRLVLRPRSDADTEILKAVSPEISAAVEAALARPGMLLAATNQECSEMLARTPGSIGLSSLTQVTTEGLAVTVLSWNGVAPTLENLATGAYPLVKTLYLVIKAPASAPVRRFVAFLASREARRILEQTGNAPLSLPPLE